MDSGDLSLVVARSRRLRREDCKQTKHDAVFSKWQVLIGPNDWEDYSKGKEGIARYRVHNLPKRSCPGLYELGVVVAQPDTNLPHPVRPRSGCDPDAILVVYLGQADSVRTRLQRYGQSGAHLGSVSLISNVATDLGDCETESPEKKVATAGLFQEIFSRGGSIVYRWAPMKTKRDAEETEARLLSTFDYAWNKGSNGERRPHDILEKVNNSDFNRFPGISRILHLPFTQKQMGIRIKGNKHVLIEEENFGNDETKEKNNFFAAIFKLSRSQPKLVSYDECEVNLDSDPLCGVILRDGNSCTRTPVIGRKRCKEHKGMRIHGFTTGESDQCKNPPGKGVRDSEIKCGIIIRDGEYCGKQPVSGRKKCEEHKGMGVKSLLSSFSPKEKLTGVENVKKENSGSKLCPGEGDINNEEGASNLCGAATRNGSFCRRKPSNGSRRCWQHGEKTCDYSSLGNKKGVNYVTCGVNLTDGLVCEKAPVKGRKRCEQHKGMRVISS